MDAFYGHFSDFSLKVRPYRKSLILQPALPPGYIQSYVSQALLRLFLWSGTQNEVWCAAVKCQIMD